MNQIAPDKKPFYSSPSFIMMSLALLVSIGFNIVQFLNKTPVLPTGQKTMSTRSFQADTSGSCSDAIDILKAQDWITSVNKAGIQFPNKSIFICSDVVRSMFDQPDFNGIWVRRGMDEYGVIHDLAWISKTTGDAEQAYPLGRNACPCPPCCGSDTSESIVYYTAATILKN
jgi:hypothetical protein